MSSLEEFRYKPNDAPDPHHTPLPSWTAPALGRMIGALTAVPAFQQHDAPTAWALTGVMTLVGLGGGLVVLVYDLARR